MEAPHTTLETAHDAAAATDPPAGRAGLRGALIGFVLLTIGVTVLGHLQGASFGGALGMGVFVGIFGGWGVGGYLGASLCLSIAQKRAEDDERRAARPQGGQDGSPPEPVSAQVRSTGLSDRSANVTTRAS